MINEQQLIFFTGIPGSRWSGQAKKMRSINKSDYNIDRAYEGDKHLGSYFGSGMEFGDGWEVVQSKDIIISEVEKAYKNHNGNILIKSHSIAYNLNGWAKQYPNNRFVLTVSDFDVCMDWWFEAGGFDITYPNYSWYKNKERMYIEAKKQHDNIQRFIDKHNIELYEHNNGAWVGVYNGNYRELF